MAEVTGKRACVVVLGDIGRSPRMQYHALSLAKNGFAVDVVGYEGSRPHSDLAESDVSFYYMKKVPAVENALPRMFTYIFKTCWQTFFLFVALMSISAPNIMLLQNPPSIPTLPVCWFVCKIWRSKLIIDFHNYGYTILSLSVGSKHILVKICAWCEKFFGRRADLNFCVTRAMKEDLAKNWNVRSHVFYDCPPDMFHPISLEEKHSLFMKLSEEHNEFKCSNKGENGSAESSRFTEKVGESIVLVRDRPALVVSSTSWTEDEDFSILLNALVEYEAVAVQKSLPKLLVAITGKGPLKSMYEALMQEKNLQHVKIVTLWLAAEDYPMFLASADLGVCLHKSSSGLDLPMKVVDMFGSGLPVCAVSYSCIDELVKNGENGLLFSSCAELANHLQVLLKGFPDEAKVLENYKNYITEAPLPRWNEKWNECILPLVVELIT